MASYSFVEALRAIASYENISLTEAEQRFYALQVPTAHVPPPAAAPATPAPVNWSSILRTTLASAGKYKAGDQDIKQWLDSFIDNVELTTDKDIGTLPFEQVRKLLTSCVEPGVQSHVNGLVNVTSFQQLKSALYHKYGKSLRQV